MFHDRWKIAEYARHADVHALNKLFINKYLESRRHGASLQLCQMHIPGVSRVQNVFTIGARADDADADADGAAAAPVL
ncbi:hypothetical protein FJT64_000222 [Amphibalanus amphitrite]|uniref:Uncharacterized protein n=1 Tax=Amphibalanus amphitrite TaxID=1232801 RepID=A0A6A4WTP2_AMPAM|nr:hypothetical protein FJT64_000222 [Amphibalanus amphitrite]